MIYYNQGKGKTEREVRDMTRTTKTYRKEFQYRGQQINYYNKVRKNNKVVSLKMYITADCRYIVEYEF